MLQTGHTGSVNALALSPDGRFLVSGSEDVTLKIWDTATGNVLRTLSGHDQPVLAAAISPDGRWIASGGADATVRVWNVRDRGVDPDGLALRAPSRTWCSATTASG